MRKVSILIGICMLVALALTLMAQGPPDLSPIMKDVAATQNSLRMNLMNNAAADVEKDAAKLQDDFTKAMGFFKAMKAQDAVDTAKANIDRAGEIAKAAIERVAAASMVARKVGRTDILHILRGAL